MIGEITNVISNINGITTTIAAAIEEQSAATREIAQNVQQTAQVTTVVTENISAVSEAAMSTGAASNEVLQAAAELARNSEVLRAEYEQFIQIIRSA
jgi:methyl-accepting chemotaxis protein